MKRPSRARPLMLLAPAALALAGCGSDRATGDRLTAAEICVEEYEPDPAAPRAWRVLSRDSGYLGDVRVPAGFHVLDIGADHPQTGWGGMAQKGSSPSAGPSDLPRADAEHCQFRPRRPSWEVLQP